MQLLAGVGRADITPAPGTPQGGWGAQTHVRGTAADMPMLVTVLALQQNETRVLIVDLDAIGFDAEGTKKIVDAVSRLTSVPHDAIRFSCSHTHGGPNTFRLNNIDDGLDMAISYLEGLPLRIAGAAWQAMQQMVPIFLAAGQGASYINRKRRVVCPDGETVVGVHEDEPADHSLGVIRFDREDGETLATMVHYACHPTTCGWQNTRFTPDYPGVTRQVVEREIGGVCLFLQGAAGDLGPRRGFTGDLSVYKLLGHELGLAAAAVAGALTTQPVKQHFDSVMPSGANIAQYRYEPVPQIVSQLSVMSTVMNLPVRGQEDAVKIAADVDTLWATVQRLRGDGKTEEMRRMQARATQMGWRLANAKLYGGMEHTPWPLQVIRIGDIALVSMAGEPFSSIGERIRKASTAGYTFVSGYSNGGFGYIPDREAYGSGGYEVAATPFSEDAADVVVSKALEVLNEVFEEARNV